MMGLLDQYAKFRDYIAANTPRSTRPVAKPGDVLREGLLSPNEFNAPAANRFKDSALGLLGGAPGVGDYASGVQAADLFSRGEKLAGSLAALGALPIIPNLAAGAATLGGLGVMHKVAQKIGTPLPAGQARNQAGVIAYAGEAAKRGDGLLGVEDNAGMSDAAKWVKPDPNQFNVDGMLDRDAYSKAAKQFNIDRMNALVAELKKHGIEAEYPGMGYSRNSYMNWVNGVGGVSSYTHVPGLGEVRFSDHLRSTLSNDSTYNTPEEVIKKLIETGKIKQK